MNSIHTQETIKSNEEKESPPKKLKVLELCAVDFTVYHFILPLGKALRDVYDIHFSSSPGPYVEKIKNEGFPFHSVSISRSYNFFSHIKSLVAIRKLITREHFDIVHTHTPVASLIGRFAAKLSGVPLILYTAHGFYFHDRMNPLMRRIFVGLEKLGSVFTDYIFTVSMEDFDSAVAMKIIRKNKIAYVGNGVDLERFSPKRFIGMRNQIRKRLGISEHQPVVCVVGRLVREKGYFELIQAIELVVKKVPGVVILVVGGALESDYDDASEKILEMVREKKLEDRFHFLSFRFDVEELLYASDLFTLPSYREGLPVSILEAMAMELPVVATNIRGSREAVQDGVTGIIVEVGDVEGLAAAITSLLLDGEKRISMGKRAREVVSDYFNENTVMNRQKELISRLLRQKGKMA